MTDATVTVAEFLAAAAAKRPTPGGGAVAALAGALAAAMGEMVLNYSVDKKDLAVHSAANRAALMELSGARSLLLRLLVEDQAVFAEFTAAKKRGEDLASLADACVRVPQAVATTALIILGAPIGRRPKQQVAPQRPGRLRRAGDGDHSLRDS